MEDNVLYVTVGLNGTWVNVLDLGTRTGLDDRKEDVVSFCHWFISLGLRL